MGKLREALRKSERPEDIPSNRFFEEHSRISMCSFPMGQVIKTTVYGLNDYNGDFVFIKKTINT